MQPSTAGLAPAPRAVLGQGVLYTRAPGREAEGAGDAQRYVVLVPLLDDWDSLRLMVPMLDAAVAAVPARMTLLVADDGSALPPPANLVTAASGALDAVDVLRLRRNLGHQRAIAVGLCHVAEHLPCTGVVVMDSDGEDRPADVARLIRALQGAGYATAVFAKRARRSEGLGFRASYFGFRVVHRVLTGLRVEVGNFSVLPYPLVHRIVAVSELWNHYAAAVVRARLPRTLVPTDRGARLAGQSRMNFVALVTHGISGMSVFADRIGVRVLVTTVALSIASVLAIIAVLFVRFATTRAIPGWATNAVGLLLVLLVQTIILSLLFALAVQFGRSANSFIPSRDYRTFVESIRRVFERGA